jgi:hypothetical protein
VPPCAVFELVERDDGFINAGDAARYFAGPEEWDRLDQWICARALAQIPQFELETWAATDGSTGALEGHRQRLRAAEDGHAVPLQRVGRQPQAGHPPQHAGDRDLDLGARQRGADAEVDPAAEVDVPGVAAEVEPVGLGEPRRVAGSPRRSAAARSARRRSAAGR